MEMWHFGTNNPDLGWPMVLASETEDEKHLRVHDSLGLGHRRAIVGMVVEVNTQRKKVVFASEGCLLKLAADRH